MVKNAVILADSSKFSPLKKVLGMSLIERTVLTAHKGGVEGFVVVFNEDNRWSRDVIVRLQKSDAIKKKEIVIDFRFANQKNNKLTKQAKETHFLLIEDLAVFDFRLLENLNKIKISATSSAIFVADETRCPLSRGENLLVKYSAKQQQVTGLGANLKKYNGVFAGLSVHPIKSFAKILSFSGTEWGALSPKQLREIYPDKKTQVIEVGESFAVPLLSASALRYAEKRLLKSMRKATDGFVSRNFNRYVSLFLSKRFLWMGLSPNFISFANLFLGVVAAFMIGLGKGWLPTFIAAALFQFTSIVDGCDGEVAKLAFRDSAKGAWIDTLCDQLGYLVFFVGLPIGLFRANMYTAKPNAELAWLYAGMGVLTFVSIVIMYFMMTRYVKRVSTGGSMLKIIEDIEAAGERPGLEGLINRFVFKASFIFRRDFFAFAVFVLCGFNLSFLIMWILAVLTLAQAVYLYVFSQRQFVRYGLQGQK